MSSNKIIFPDRNSNKPRFSVNTKLKVTSAQTDTLCTFFEENPEVIRGYRKTPECVDTVQAKWRKITPTLNALGPQRDCKAWAKYLCDIKAKLKRKRIKWRQNSDGTGPIICNADEFNEIKLRMLHVLRKDITSGQDSEVNDSHLDHSDEKLFTGDSEYWTKHTAEKSIKTGMKESQKPMESSHFEARINVSDDDDDDSSVDNILHPYLTRGDEFDTFGKNMAQQLRCMPLELALETQEMLIAVLRKQRLKLITQNVSQSKDINTSDPLFT